MSETILDGLGSGKRMQVDSSYRARVLSDQRDEAVYDNLCGRVFSAAWNAVTPTGGASVLAYLGNTLSSNVHIHQVEFSAEAADALLCYVDVLAATGADAAGTVTSMNLGASFALPAASASTTPGTVTFRTASAAITGTTAAATQIGVFALPAAKNYVIWKPPSRLIISPNRAFFLKTVVGGAVTRGAILFSIEPTSSIAIPS